MYRVYSEQQCCKRGERSLQPRYHRTGSCNQSATRSVQRNVANVPPPRRETAEFVVKPVTRNGKQLFLCRFKISPSSRCEQYAHILFFASCLPQINLFSFYISPIANNGHNYAVWSVSELRKFPMEKNTKTRTCICASLGNEIVCNVTYVHKNLLLYLYEIACVLESD